MWNLIYKGKYGIFFDHSVHDHSFVTLNRLHYWDHDCEWLFSHCFSFKRNSFIFLPYTIGWFNYICGPWAYLFLLIDTYILLHSHCRNLREMFKIDAADYMMSICGNDALRELSSPGKSGSIFFLSQDDRFMIKTLRKSEVKVCDACWRTSISNLSCLFTSSFLCSLNGWN